MAAIENKRVRAGKAQKVKAEILRQIEMNKFPRGSSLPPERELSQRLGISYMTVRKGVSELVEEGYLERLQGVGTFVRKDIPSAKMSKVLGVVCPAWNSPEVSDFTIHASFAAESNGWSAKLFFPRFWEDKAMEDAWSECDALMMFSLGSFNEIPPELKGKLLSGEKPLVFIGVDASGIGFDSVLGSASAIGMAISKLSQAGHRRIAMVGHAGEEIDDGVLRPVKLAVDRWRKWIDAELGPKTAESLYIYGKTPSFELEHKAVYGIVSKSEGKPPFSAVIAPFSLVLAVTAALKDKGLRVPEDVSVVAVGDRQEASYYRPRLSSVIVPLKSHVEKAMDLILRKRSPERRSASVSLVDPEWREGETICQTAKEQQR